MNIPRLAGPHRLKGDAFTVGRPRRNRRSHWREGELKPVAAIDRLRQRLPSGELA